MITDSPQAVREALVSIVNADAELRTLFGRTTNLIVPEGTRQVSETKPLPMITYTVTRVTRAASGYLAMDLEFSAFAPTDGMCGKAVTQLQALFCSAGVTWNAFGALGLQVCPNPSSLPVQIRAGIQSEPGESAECRAELLCSLLIPE